jgi:hypothetical protein
VIVARSDAGSLAEKEGLEGLRRNLRELAERLHSEGSNEGADIHGPGG